MFFFATLTSKESGKTEMMSFTLTTDAGFNVMSYSTNYMSHTSKPASRRLKVSSHAKKNVVFFSFYSK